MLIVIVVQHHIIGINRLLVIHHISGKLNSFVRWARWVLRNHQCGPGRKILETSDVDCRERRVQLAIYIYKPTWVHFDFPSWSQSMHCELFYFTN